MENFEIVFCSMDAFECEYIHYCKSMPWWCLSFQSPVTSRLATMYKAVGIPSLVVIDRDGQLLSRDAVSQVACDPTGLNFPWRPRHLVDILPEYYLHSDSDKEIFRTRDLDDKYLLIYAAGQWCQQCRHFTEKIAKAYNVLKMHREDFEVSPPIKCGLLVDLFLFALYSRISLFTPSQILFLSSDQDQESFDTFFGQMPFGAIPFEERAAKAAIANKFRIRRVPVLLVFGPRPPCGGDRPLINADARCIFESGDFIHEFPYRPPKCEDLNRTTYDISLTKCVVVFCEFCDDCEQEDIQEILRCTSACPRVSEDIKFFWVIQPTHFTQTLRDALRLPAREEVATMVLLDLPDNRSFYLSTARDLSIESVKNFLDQPGARMELL